MRGKFPSAILAHRKTVMKKAFSFLLICLIPLLTLAKVPEGFWEAVKQGNLEAVAAFVEKDPTLVKAMDDGYGPPALYYAAESGNLPLVKLLIEKGADINGSPLYKAVPLETAASLGHLEVVKFLLEQNPRYLCVDPLYKDFTMDVAVNNHQLALVEFMTTKGLDTTFYLIDAIQAQDIPMIKLLIKKGADVNRRYKQGDANASSALDAAIKFAPNVVKLLIENGARPCLDDLDTAASRGDSELVALLKKELRFSDPLFCPQKRKYK